MYSEFWNAILRISLSPFFGENLNLRDMIKNEFGKIKPHIGDVKDKFNLLLELLSKYFIYISIQTSPDIMKEALELQNVYGFDINDSIHLATVIFGKNKDFVTFDKNLIKIPNINYWWKYSQTVSPSP